MESSRIVRWKTQHLPAGTVALELSSDEGATWAEAARAPSGDLQLTWRVNGPTGSARVRLSVVGSDVSSRPKKVWIAPALRGVEFGSYLGFALMSDGTMRVWGSPQEGGPLPAYHTIYRPKVLAGFADIKAIAIYYDCVLAVRNDGALLEWGDFDGPTNPGPLLTTPTVVEGIAGARSVWIGFGDVFVRLEDGRVLAWGRDNYLALGRDAPGVEGVYDAVSPSPGEVLGLGHAVGIGGWPDGGCALRDDGVLFGWGQNRFGEVSDGTRTPRPRPVPCLLDHVDRFFGCYAVFAVRTDGSVRVWGSDAGEILANGKRISTAKPQRIFMK